MGLDFDGFEGKAVSDIFGKYAHAFLVDMVTRVNFFVKDYVADGYFHFTYNKCSNKNS